MDPNDVKIALILGLTALSLAASVSSCTDKQNYRKVEACKAFLASDASIESKSRAIDYGGVCRVGQ